MEKIIVFSKSQKKLQLRQNAPKFNQIFTLKTRKRLSWAFSTTTFIAAV